MRVYVYISKSNDLPATQPTCQPANQPTSQPAKQPLANPHTLTPSHPAHPASLSAMFTGGGKVVLTWDFGEKPGVSGPIRGGRFYSCFTVSDLGE